jgi:gamma-glutamyl-gamma-aminobutyrate hydrolase PuuD
VKVAPGTWVGEIFGSEVDVHCHHHQAVDTVGAGLVPVAWAGDGTVEAVESTEPEFVLGVQWHPEEDGMDRRLFQALVNAAKGK